MPNPNAIVAQSIRLDPEFGRTPAAILRERGDVPVQLDGERIVSINAADPGAAGQAQVLEGLAKIRHPVYLEVDPSSSAIKRIQVPLVARVGAIREGDKGLEITLEPSHARHLLNRDSPWFGEFAGLLREGLSSGKVLIVSEDELHQILDVRSFKPGPDDVPLPEWPKPELPLEPDWWRKFKNWFRDWWIWPWNWRRCISPGKAQQVFDAMSATTCNPLTVPPPCIPFLYPDDGCWGRAHEMCRLMIAMGLKPKKVWIQGSLNTPTKNNPQCFVGWNWHVAPTLCVRKGWFSKSQQVVDPSLFTTPVSQATWKGVQGDPNATLTPSGADIFYLWGNQTDPTYTQTNQVLATYRLALQNRALSIGPPPYANCP
jgi:Glutaminase